MPNPTSESSSTAGGQPPKGRMSGLAVTALVLSCLFFLPLIPLIGAVLGIIAVVSIRPPTRGRGLAIAAIPVGFSTAFFIQGILAAAAIPAFINYTKRAKTSEANFVLSALRDAAARYAEGQTPPRFPVAETGWTPALSCCAGGQRQACQLNPAVWAATPWVELGFTPKARHYFQWRYASDGSEVTAEARADLDCDNQYSSYLLSGRITDGQMRFDDIRISAPLE
jgi:type II secretory pathway pseudopilin PulG